MEVVTKEHLALPESGVEIETAPEKVADWVECLMAAEGAQLKISGSDGETYPVVIKEAIEHRFLLLDISSVPDKYASRKRFPATTDGIYAALPTGDQQTEDEELKSPYPGIVVQLSCFRSNAQIYAPELAIFDYRDSGDSRQLLVRYPQKVRLIYRRQDFRAELRTGLVVDVRARSHNDNLSQTGLLKDLSVSGCKVQFGLKAVDLLLAGEIFSLTLVFPNGDAITVEAEKCHHDLHQDQRRILVGYRFVNMQASQHKKIWYFVREIERERARSLDSSRELAPSALFTSTDTAPVTESTRPQVNYATPTALQLARIGEFLSAQTLGLTDGHKIDSPQLSRHADRLLALLKSDPDEVLFSLLCLQESYLICHSLRVATWMTHIVLSLPMPVETVKAIAAAALVHDLGKGVEPNPSDEVPMSADDRIHLIEERLASCTWLANEVRREVVGQINERLDGSGLPRGLSGSEISQLGRLAAVVKYAAQRLYPEGDIAPISTKQLSDHMLAKGEQFDRKWVLFFIKHFGTTPAGSFVISDSQQRGWVRQVNERGECQALVPYKGSAIPTQHDVVAEIRGRDLRELGGFTAIVGPR